MRQGILAQDLGLVWRPFQRGFGEIQGRGGEGAVIDDKIDLNLVFYGLDYDFGFIFDHLRNKHSGNHFFMRGGTGHLLFFNLLNLFR